MSDFSKPPSTAKLQPQPFKAEIDATEIQDFKRLLALSKIGPATFENQQSDRRFGITRDWLIEAKKHWETTYDWRNCEREINSFPNFTIPLKDDKGYDFTIHFVALFSQKQDAIPLLFLHGWPGSFLEFLPMLSVIKEQYPKAEDLPYHIIVPSLPGYAFSTGPHLDQDWGFDDMTPLMNKLMVSLGFGSGYIAQGGDLGSFVARQLAINYDECKGFHLNLSMISPPDNADQLPITAEEKTGLERAEAFRTSGIAYAMEHGTRTATIGLTLSSSPLALLSWIGEKYLEWTDTDPSLNTILDSVTLYWLTSTYPRSIYPYRQNFSGKRDPSATKPNSPKIFCKKPQGYSWFPKEIAPMPIEWVKQSGNLVWAQRHESGGHFAALEKPEVLWGDVVAFVDVWKRGDGNLEAKL